jgi:condensation domain-containing protein
MSNHSLSSVKRELFARLLQKRGLRSGDREPITRRPGPGPCLLSFAQRRLWFVDQLESGAAAYNIPLAVRLEGQLDVTALERSLNEVERRHEVLRTVFALDAEQQPVQVVQPWRPRSLPVRELPGATPAEREHAARQATLEEARRPFSLQQGPLWRAELLRLADHEHILLLTMHHIISDGWSMGILIREIATLYEAFSQGAASPLSELTIQYADFARWQRNWLHGAVLDEQMQFWREQLSGELPAIELPTDHPRPKHQSYRGERQSFQLNAALTERLKQLSREHDATLFMTLLAGFQTLLHRYSGQEDIVVGTPIANRNRAEIEDLIGFFVNTLVLRTRLNGEQTFTDLLGQVREVTLGAYAHQDVPFEKLVEELQPERDTSRHPLFQVVFVLQNAPVALPQLSGLTVTNLNVEPETAKFDIVVNVHETAEGLAGVIAYNTDLFDAPTLTRLMNHYESLLEAIVAHPSAPLKSFDLLTEEEKHILETKIEVEDLSGSFCF